MPQKPAKFNKFSVAESLEKVAVEKGLVKLETSKQFKKVAEVVQKMANLAPTENLSENIVKLCDGLRSQGFNKYADEVEVKFLQYKKAQSIYDVTKEKGEDLVDRAHPEGSHQMKDVEGDSLIETIVDKHNKIKKIVEKTPTGKLAAKDAANIARIILAEADPETTINENMQNAAAWWRKIDSIVRDKGDLSMVPQVGRFWDYALEAKALDYKLSRRPITVDLADEITTRIKRIRDLISPGITGGVSQQAWEELGSGSVFDNMLGFISKAKLAVESQIKVRRQEVFQSEEEPKVSPSVAKEDPALTKWNSLIQRLSASDKINEQGKKIAVDYLNQRKLELADPAKHDAAAKAINEMEQHLIDKNLI